MVQMSGDAIVVFTRYPEPGQAKTRLIPALGPAGAADLQRRMTLHTLQRIASCPAAIEVRYEGGDETAMAAYFGKGRRYHPQGGGHLGQRMARAVVDHFRGGADRIILIGADCPDISAQILQQAFEDLSDHDLVLGPATDGGYYLIGLRCIAPGLFEGVEWGGPDVLRQTLQLAETIKLRVSLLDVLPDVDRPEDLSHWQTAAAPGQAISIIIPTLNEAAALERTLEQIHAAADGQDVQIIVSDGGSRDETVPIAQRLGVRVVSGPAGRAVQMNVGAAAACGDLLIFCHADTRLPNHFSRIVRDVLSRADVALGAFTLRIDDPAPALRRIERVARFRSVRLKLPYGDQVLFMRRSTFDRLGGFFPMPAMEDFDLVRRARRLGHIITVDAPATTSARTWQRCGVWRITLIHQFMIAGYYLGVSPQTLARLRAAWAR